MKATQMPMEEGAIWSRLLEPNKATLSADAAQAILALDFPQEDKERLRQLAAKAREGALTAEDQDDVAAYGRVGSLLSIMKSKARKSLNQATSR